ncbi:HET-domain-containing protein [Glonium stellatum]|uniref:HET-domain-containing protein n=1 Tax=Glonium stellatum TaxID=574774 RepID=A0A8E2FDF9_9PEZI|nr:HET-domain-containing protein [Glonium stellatum]
MNETNEPYEALSYCWGSESPSSPILVNESYQISVRANLESALRRLRHKEKSRYLWIDAICINQEDIQEKAHQVARMADIYNEAGQVNVWLGEENEDSALAIDFIKRHLLNLEEFDYLTTVPAKREWSALARLLRRPWFTRRWVIPEIALATQATLHCGRDTISWLDFADAVSLMGTKSQFISKLLQESYPIPFKPDSCGGFQPVGAALLVDVQSRLFRKTEGGMIAERLLNLEVLVCSLAEFSVSESRDVIYAVLALAKDVRPMAEDTSIKPAMMTPQSMSVVSNQREHDDQGVPSRNLPAVMGAISRMKSRFAEKIYTVDYGKSFYEVCKEFLAFIFSASRSLDIICRPWAPDNAKERLPSWIISLRGAPFGYGPKGQAGRKNADSLVGFSGTGHKSYNAAGSTSPKWRFGDVDSHDSLYVQGFILDSVVERSEAALGGNIPFEWLEFGGWDDLSEHPPEKFWRTLVADRGHNLDVAHSYYSRACMFAVQKGVSGAVLNTDLLLATGVPSIVMDFLRRVQSVVWMRKLIKTQHAKLLGLAPKHTRRGDLVCILYGCSVPVILREVAQQPKPYYEFIGECYLHSMMEGEACRVQSERNITKQHFEIR